MSKYKINVAKQRYNEARERMLLSALESVVMPRSLTAENGAKALLMGEFFEEHKCRYYDEDGELVEYTEKVPVSWTTIKEIYAKIVSHYGA